MAEKNKGGRHTDYRAEFDAQAYKLTLLGFTDQDLATFFEVTEQTVNNWKKAHPTFFESLTRGNAIADAEVAESFYNRARGFDKDVEEAQVILIGDGTQRVEVVTFKKYFPPEKGAQLSWLKNRQPKLWRDKQETELSGSVGTVLMPKAIGENDTENS